jgi:hypothetical protein
MNPIAWLMDALYQRRLKRHSEQMHEWLDRERAEDVQLFQCKLSDEQKLEDLIEEEILKEKELKRDK